MLTFNLRYFIWAVLLFLTEVCIALFVDDQIVRPYIGDVLVVILIYCFVRSFVVVPVWTLAICTLLFAYFIELLQYFKIVKVLGLEQFTLARVVIGTSFSWIDMLCYTIGVAIIVWVEKVLVHPGKAARVEAIGR